MNDTKERYVKALIESKAFLIKSIDEEPFTLRSGKRSYMFLNHGILALNPTHYKTFIDAIDEILRNAYGNEEYILCNVDSKISAQMVGSLAYILSKRQIIFKSSALAKIEKGVQKQLTGDKEWTSPVALIDDVMTGGDGTAKNVGDLIKNEFRKMKNIQIFVGFIRDPKESTYKTHYVVTRDELLERVSDTLSEGQKQAINREMQGYL